MTPRSVRLLACLLLLFVGAACSSSSKSSSDASTNDLLSGDTQLSDSTPGDSTPSDSSPGDLTAIDSTTTDATTGDQMPSDAAGTDSTTGDSVEPGGCGSSAYAGSHETVKDKAPLPTGVQPALLSCTAGVWYKIRVATRSQPLIRVALSTPASLAIDLQLYSKPPSDPSWQAEGDRVGTSIDLALSGQNALVANTTRVLEPGVDYYLWLIVSKIDGLVIPVEASYTLTLLAGCTTDDDCKQAAPSLPLCNAGICLDCKSGTDCLASDNGPSCDAFVGCSCGVGLSNQCLAPATCVDDAIGASDDKIGFCQ